MLGKTSKELKKELHNYVLQTANEMLLEIRKKKEKQDLKVKNTDLCIN